MSTGRAALCLLWCVGERSQHKACEAAVLTTSKKDSHLQGE